MKQDQIRRTRDPEVRAELAPQITQLKTDLRKARHDVGIYVMSYVRSIMPKAAWSIWARVGQQLVRRPAGGVDVWRALADRPGPHASAAEGMYARVRAELAARASGDVRA